MKRRAGNGFAGVRVALVFALTGLIGTPVLAQDTTDNGATKLEKVEVTGSRIKRLDVEGPTPVTTITRDQIEKSGYTSVQDLLRNLSQNTGGTIDQSFTFGFTPGAAGVDLRGFGAGRTLILLDGRRLPAYPVGISGTDSFTDLSTIPTVMIERIEVLTDGASAIYGSDAISGVINIITRKDIHDSFGSVRVGGTQHGGGANQRVQAVTGVMTNNSSMSLFAEYFNQKAIHISQRDYSKSDFTGDGNGSSFGSTFFGFDGQVIPDPNCGTPQDALGGLGHPTAAGICRFDRTPFREYQPDMRHGALAVRYDRDFGGIHAYTRMSYFTSQTNSQFEPNAYSGGEGFDPVNPFQQIIPFTTANFGTVPAGASNNPTTGTGAETDGFFQRRLVEYGPRGDDVATDDILLLQGVRGAFGEGWTWDVGAQYGRERVRDQSLNILSSVLDNEVANNGLDLFQPIPQDVIDRTRFQKIKDSNSSSFQVDGTLTGPLPISLPGGNVQLAFHPEAVYERYFDRADPLSSLGDAFDGASSGGGDRAHYAGALEFSLPIFKQLEFDIAGRYDHYNDSSSVGGQFTPKASLMYRPIESVYFRASAGKSFRAPDLQRLFGGPTKAFDSAIDTPLCIQQGGTPNVTDTIPACVEPVQSISIRVLSNPDLSAERGKNFSVGAGYEPVRDLTLKVDYWWIQLRDIVVDPSTQSVLDNCALFNVGCDQIVRAPADTNGDGQTLDELGSFVKLGAQNQALERIKGIDFSAAYRMNAGAAGRFALNYDMTWVHSNVLQLTSDSAATEQLYFASIPRWRFNTLIDWSLANFGAFVRADYVDEYPGAFGSDHPAKDEFFSSFLTFDAQLRFMANRFGTIRLGVDNIFDRDMPLDPTAHGGNRPNQFIDATQTTFHNAIGRAFYAQYEIKF
jgi:iron complex outermembrane receptor protein